MEAFNVPFCGIDLNQAIGNLTFASSQTYAIRDLSSYTHNVSCDICTIHITVAPLTANMNGWAFAITSTKDGSFNNIAVTTGGIGISKSGNTITMNRTSGATGTYLATFIIYEFNFT